MLDQTATNLPSLLDDPSLLQTKAYVNGEWITGGDGEFEVTNPARGDVIAKVANLSRAQVAGAIDGAYAAQKEWAAWTAKERSNVMRKWFDLIMANQKDLATILTARADRPPPTGGRLRGSASKTDCHPPMSGRTGRSTGLPE